VPPSFGQLFPRNSFPLYQAHRARFRRAAFLFVPRSRAFPPHTKYVPSSLRQPNKIGLHEYAPDHMRFPSPSIFFPGGIINPLPRQVKVPSRVHTRSFHPRRQNFSYATFFALIHTSARTGLVGFRSWSSPAFHPLFSFPGRWS